MRKRARKFRGKQYDLNACLPQCVRQLNCHMDDDIFWLAVTPLLFLLFAIIVVVIYGVRRGKCLKRYGIKPCAKCGAKYQPGVSFGGGQGTLCNRCYEIENGIRPQRLILRFFYFSVPVLGGFMVGALSAGGMYLVTSHFLPDWYRGEHMFLGFSGQTVIILFVVVTGIFGFASAFFKGMEIVLRHNKIAKERPNLRYEMKTPPPGHGVLYLFRSGQLDLFGNSYDFDLALNGQFLTKLKEAQFCSIFLEKGEHKLRAHAQTHACAVAKEISIKLDDQERKWIMIDGAASSGSGQFMHLVETFEGDALYAITFCEERTIGDQENPHNASGI